MKRWLLWGIPAVLLVALVVWRFANRPATTGARGQGAARGGPAGGGAGGRNATANVEVAQAALRTIVDSIQAVGNVESPYKVAISPRSSGRIEYLEVREGDPVVPGQVLVRIDPSDLQGQVAQQQANVAEARSRLAQAQLTQGSTDVGISSQIAQQRAGLTSAQADLNQVRRNYDAQVAAANSAVTDAEAKVRSAEAQVRNALAEVDRQQANLTNAETRLKRTTSLYQQGFIAAQEADDARTAVEVQRGALKVAQGQLDAARSSVSSAQAQRTAAQNNASITARKGQADIAAAQARVTQAQASVKVAQANRSQSPAYRQNLAALQSSVDAALAQLAQARSRLQDTVLKASIKGTVTKRNADPGTLASPGTPVLEVQFLDWLYVTTSLPVEQSGAIHEGQIAQVRFDALPNRVFAGPITNVNAAADPETRQFGIRIKLNNADHAVRPGMYARVAVESRRVENAVVVPREAVRTTPEGSTVTVVDAENTAHVVSVKLGAQDATGVQIMNGVSPRDKVVVLSYTPVRDGQKVSVGGGRPQGGGRGGQRTGGNGGQRPGQGAGGRAQRGGGQS